MSPSDRILAPTCVAVVPTDTLPVNENCGAPQLVTALPSAYAVPPPLKSICPCPPPFVGPITLLVSVSYTHLRAHET